MCLVLYFKDLIVNCAFTGIAAHQIHGKTIHDLLQIKGRKITSKQLSAVRNALKGKKAILIDEKSFIGKRFLNLISKILKLAFNSDKP